MSSPIRPLHESGSGRPRASIFRTLGFVALTALVGMHTVGCTILFPLGAGTTDLGSKARLVPAEDLVAIEPGARLRISDLHGPLAEGEFQSIGLDSDSAYARRLAAAGTLAEAAALPRLGETVRIAPRSDRAVTGIATGRFAGFDYRGVRVWDTQGRVKHFDMMKVDSLWREDGRGTSGTELARLDAGHALPSLTTIVIERKGRGPDGRRRTTHVAVPWESALRVESVQRQTRAAQGLVMGLLVDGLVVAAAVGASSNSGCSPGPIQLSRALPEHPELRHVRPMTQDFDLLAGRPVESGPALAAR